VIAAASLGFILYASSRHEDAHPVAVVGGSTPAVTAEQTDPAPLSRATSASMTGGTKPSGDGRSFVSADSLPPEVAAYGPDTLVTVGEVIEITARGSADVCKMILTDGLGKKQTMTYDAAENLWSTFYRVPLRLSTERAELSVTASNGHDRWRRVWVFVDVDRGDVEQ
jgi:hypothetical protein